MVNKKFSGKKKILQMEPWFDEKEARAIYAYIKSGGWLTEFKKTEELEMAIAKFIGAKYCVLTNNGTISLTLAMIALGLKAGDEILIPDLTMIASPNSAQMIGINPLLVDIEPITLGMDLKDAERKITKRTRALMYVAFNGRSGDMEEIVAFCQKHKLFLIEDSAQALGSYWEGKHLGTFGEVGSFSFSVPKVITTGQGGALVTNSKTLYGKLKKLKDFGRDKGGVDFHPYMGWNFKFTDLQAVIGIEQMKKLPVRLKKKKQIHKWYQEGLKKVRQVKFLPTNLKDTSPWFIDIFVQNPDKLASFLSKKGIGTRRIYPAVHTQKIWEEKFRQYKFPIAQEFATKGLWLPSSARLTRHQVGYVIKSIKDYYHAN